MTTERFFSIITLIILLTIANLPDLHSNLVVNEQREVTEVEETYHTGLLSSFRSQVIEFFNNIFPPVLTVFFISMLPIFELRGSIPVGINYFGLNPVIVVFLSIVGNMIPIFFVLLFFDWIAKIISHIPVLNRLLDFILRRTRNRTAVVEKYEELGLIAFVALPLPITGAWTGSLAAYLLGFNFWKSVLFIFLGVLIAATIVTTLSLMGWTGAIIALTVFSLLILKKLIDLHKDYRQKRKSNGTI